MIDHDLSHQLHTLAATVDEPLDLAALHRRISVHNRRRAAARVGFAGVGVAAVVGGLFVVRDQRSGPAQSGFASSPAESSAPTAVSDSTPVVEQPATLPDCAYVLADLSTRATDDSEVPKDVPGGPASSADELGEHGFKGIVTITAIDGPQLSFTVDQPDFALPSSGLGTLDETTEWMDGPTPLTTPPALAVGEQLGLATKPDAEGVDRVLFVDVGAMAAAGKPDSDEKPTADGAPLSDEQLDKMAEAATGNSGEDKAPAPGTALPGVSVVDDSTEKSTATITASDATTLTATLDDRAGETQAITIDVAATPFYAGDAICVPGVLAVGDEIGVAYHLDAAGTLVADSVMLMP